MAIKYNFTMDFEAIDKAIPSIHNRGKKLREDIHAVNVSLLGQWIKTGDVSAVAQRASKLITHADGYMAQALVNWYTVHAGFEWNQKEGLFTYSPDLTTIDMDAAKAAKAEPFWELTPPKEPKAFKLDEQIRNLIKKAKKKREDGLVEDFDYVPEEMLKALETTLVQGQPEPNF